VYITSVMLFTKTFGADFVIDIYQTN